MARSSTGGVKGVGWKGKGRNGSAMWVRTKAMTSALSAWEGGGTEHVGSDGSSGWSTWVAVICRGGS
ncbi:hypothetical protein GUJ93_ZPchr0037g2878 [Zizania palustris]|uniref:Uncharacterized protein n=1 Tax=Zizania palustris TaxID=103762 RepID=A0A8J5USD9_ZIZPA|nr:hypothetical protein GUJ93_ZPchr0037g2878 [Zizania palustris]